MNSNYSFNFLISQSYSYGSPHFPSQGYPSSDGYRSTTGSNACEVVELVYIVHVNDIYVSTVVRSSITEGDSRCFDQ